MVHVCWAQAPSGVSCQSAYNHIFTNMGSCCTFKECQQRPGTSWAYEPKAHARYNIMSRYLLRCAGCLWSAMQHGCVQEYDTWGSVTNGISCQAELLKRGCVWTIARQKLPCGYLQGCMQGCAGHCSTLLVSGWVTCIAVSIIKSPVLCLLLCSVLCSSSAHDASCVFWLDLC